MKQIMHNLSNGTTELVDAPVPICRDGHVLIDSTASLISIGTERMLVDFGRAGVIAKARQQPEKVKQVLEKVKTDGLLTTVDAVRSKLGQPIPLGYCNVGVAAESRAIGIAAGDRVISNGSHADVVCMPRNLCAKIPQGVSDETAAFTVVASIGLQGLRLAQPTLGECFVVIGAGLIGLLTVQMLRAQGCRVLAVDFDAAKLELARSFGAEICNPAAGEDPIACGLSFSRQGGVDGVIITASTKSSDPVTQAARMCRQRGRIILVGVTGLELNRADFYEKELSFQVSCSYGPGRYDPAYEENGQDYPLGFVRWTEQRNFEAVLDLMASGRIDTARLVTHRFAFIKAPKAYDLLSADKTALGIILEYDHPVVDRHQKVVPLVPASVPTHNPAAANIGMIGAGNYASRMLIPALRSAGANMVQIASTGGTSAVIHGRNGDFESATTDTEAMLANPAIDTIAIVTRHNSHSRFTCDALRAGKHVFVEKPLALTLAELANVEAAYAASGRQLMVGYNRRFAPLVAKMKALADGVRDPKSLIMVMNAK